MAMRGGKWRYLRTTRTSRKAASGGGVVRTGDKETKAEFIAVLVPAPENGHLAYYVEIPGANGQANTIVGAKKDVS